MSRALHVAQLTSPEAADRPLLLLPVGSCEQHGPHLPLGTDTLVACAVAEATAARFPDAVLAPPLAVTASGEHAGFAGTLSLGTATTAGVIVELVRSADWTAGVVLVNGHGGNNDAVAEATAMLAGEGRRVLSWWPRVPGGDAHAGRTETSLVLALAPELVRLELAEPGATRPIAELAAALRSGGVGAVSPNGVLGDPSGASASEGRDLLAGFVDDLVAAIGSWDRR